MDNNGEEMVGEINLDQVRDALNDMGGQNKASSVNSSPKFESMGSSSKFESLNKGLKPPRLVGNRRAPDVTNDVLEESIEGRSALMEVADDAKLALNQIHDFNNLGYRFK